MRRMLLALAILLPRDEVDTRIKEFTDAMKAAKSDPDRLAAIENFSRTRHFKVAQKLVQVAGSPYAEEVRVAAADAAGKIGDPKAGPALQQVLNGFGSLIASENPKTPADQKVAEAVVRAIGACRDRTAVPRLAQILTKNNIPLMAETVRALGKIRDAGALDNLVRLHYAATRGETAATPNPRKPLMDDTLAALRRITGQKLTTGEEWQDWWRGAKGRFVPSPEEAPSGLPDVLSFAVYSGKGETKKLAKFDLVLLKPESYAKDELAGLRAVALSGDVQAALDKGFAGAVVDPDAAADVRRKFPKAILISRGGAKKAGPHVNAILVADLDPKAAEDLKEARTKHDAVILALFVADAVDAVKFARDQGFLVYVAPDKEHAALAD